jgi:hypothetical protein
MYPRLNQYLSMGYFLKYMHPHLAPTHPFGILPVTPVQLAPMAPFSI